ncbi:MAG TPA: hypothetical protein VGK19_24610 [Capsulimonadaceae bacterium]|jgi:hypothetical protein
MAQVSFYQLTKVGNYIDTASTTERTTLLAGGWTETCSPTCGIFENAADYTGLTALYRLKKVSNSARFYTTDSTTKTNMINSGAWSDEGTAGYVLPASASQPAGWGALHEAYNASTSFYIFTASTTQWNGLVSPWNKSATVFAWVPSPHS